MCEQHTCVAILEHLDCIFFPKPETHRASGACGIIGQRYRKYGDQVLQRMSERAVHEQGLIPSLAGQGGRGMCAGLQEELGSVT